MDKNIKKVKQRAIQYWFIDGLAEISSGLLCLLGAPFFWNWQVVFQVVFTIGRWGLLIVLTVGLVVSFGLRLIIQRIKERSTYIQTGYVTPFSGLEDKRSVVIAVALTIFFLGSNFYLTFLGKQALLWSCGLAGLVFAFAFTWTGYLTALRRFYFLAFFSLIVGVTLAFLGFGAWDGTAILIGLIGLILLFLGCQTRLVYMHQNPALTK